MCGFVLFGHTKWDFRFLQERQQIGIVAADGRNERSVADPVRTEPEDGFRFDIVVNFCAEW